MIGPTLGEKVPSASEGQRMEKYKVLGGRVPAGSQQRMVVQVEARSEQRSNIMTARRNIPSSRRLFLKTRVVETVHFIYGETIFQFLDVSRKSKIQSQSEETEKEFCARQFSWLPA